MAAAAGPLATYLAKDVNHVIALSHSSPPSAADATTNVAIGGDDEAGRPSEQRVSVLTWNVWFDLDDWQLRFVGVSDIIRRLQPTVVCLQEVTQQFARALKRDPWLSQHYHMLDADDDKVLQTVEPYGVAMLSLYPFDRLELHENHSLMHRNTLLAEITIHGKKALTSAIGGHNRPSPGADSLCCADFDGFSPPLRKAQLNKINLLDAVDGEGEPDDQVALRIITGDFNFPAGSKEEEGVRTSYTDTWNALRPDEPGHTNGVTYPRPRSRPSRYDRILYRSDGYRVREVTTVGAESIGRRGGTGAGAIKDIFPSDHLGVFVVLEEFSSSTPVLPLVVASSNRERETAILFFLVGLLARAGKSN